MIVGTGTDLIEIERVRKACERPAFLQKVFTENERREASDNIRKLSGDFAVKEAVAKALGTGFVKFGPSDIEVQRDPMGKPYVTLYGGALKRAGEIGADNIQVSISDTMHYALAFAIAEKL